MRTIYIDSEFQCHVTNDGTMTAVETDFFDGKCDAFVEGHRYVPAGENWTAPDGNLYPGRMVVAWQDFGQLEAAQRQYERALIKELQENSVPLSELELAYQEGVNSV